MPSWIIALVLGIGVTAWAYSKLARSNGNASPQSNMIIAAIAGFVIFLIMLSLLKLVLNF
jgi:hypothetical protein